MTHESTPRDVVDAVLGPPTEEVITAISEDVEPDALAVRLKQELDARSGAEAHRLHVVDDLASASATARATRAEPGAIHVVAVRAGLGREGWKRIDFGRSRNTLAALVLVLSPGSYAEARVSARNLTSLATLTTHHVRTAPLAPERFRVVAHPMHENEHAAVLGAAGPMRQLEESLVVGELDRDEIDRLRAQNILVDVYGAVEVPAAPGRAKLWSPLADDLKADRDEWPADFTATIDLAALMLLQRQPPAGVDALEPRGDRRYRVRLADAAARDALAGRPGVCDVARIDAAAEAPALESIDPDAVWTVLLHDASTRDAVRERLEKEGAAVLKSDGRALRITATSSVITRAQRWSEVRRIYSYVEPTLSADIYRKQVGLEVEDAAGAPIEALQWDGTGEVVAVADSGIDAAHPALQPVIVGLQALAGTGADAHGHGTHVAGIIAGQGVVRASLRGAAPGARLYVQCIVDADGKLSGLPADLGTLLQAAYDRGARVHNNSWGAEVEGHYEAQAEQIDDFVWKHRDMLVVIAAGNRGSAAKPTDRSPTAEIGCVEYGSLDAPAVAKNAITVGACQSGRTAGGRSEDTWGSRWANQFPDDPVRSKRISGAPESMAAFSSRGPVESSRIKPDLVAPGTDVASTWPDGHPGDNSWGVVPGTERRYRFLGGTSMAAPIVAGCAARVRQYYRDERHHEPSAALVKATLMNGARPLTGPDANHRHPAPNFHQGFGCVDMRRTVPLPGAGFVLAFVDPWQDRAQWFPRPVYRGRFALTASGALRICLAWTDPPGPGRWNGFRLVVEPPDGSKRRGNEERAGKIPERPDDESNTVLAVRLDEAPAGPYTVSVMATTLGKPPQDFALVVTGPLDRDHLF
ncbi:MAG: S8 family serine peptidase [Deltaproteobacteria bacterium]|nr:S8 family serine peptidase [Myxococcales bacterium]MDP3215221.1 S8 family serine peptidase [Deltaproteobacteria bacterium]